MDKVSFKNKFLVLRSTAALLIILFVTLPYVTSTSEIISVIMFGFTLFLFVVCENMFRKTLEKADDLSMKESF